MFARLQQRLALHTLLSITLGLLFVSAALLRLGLWLGSPQALVFGLVLWYRLLYVLLGLVFWGLAGRLLDLRQGKRLFGLVGTGELLPVSPATSAYRCWSAAWAPPIFCSSPPPSCWRMGVGCPDRPAVWGTDGEADGACISAASCRRGVAPGGMYS